jgi:hypothetical protein
MVNTVEKDWQNSWILSTEWAKKIKIKSVSFSEMGHALLV